MSKVNEKWKKTFPDTIGNQNRPETGVDDTQPFETGAFPQYMANDPVRYDLQNAAMSQSMSNDARLKEMVDARGKELDDHKVDPGAHKTGIAGNAATATKVVATAAAGASANIAEATMASSDLARIRVSGATNAGELALETADDGSEPIVARQYMGVYETPVRTAKILDESGNTSFPGTVVAPKFTGILNGNAATATKLQTPRTLSLTGKAAGSTTFDGSANASINVTSVNADTASKLSTARKINITGNATGAATFDGSGDININTTVNESKHAAAANSATNADTVDGVHAASLFYNKGNWASDNWATIGTYQVNGNQPVSGAHQCGQVISSSTSYARFQLYASHKFARTGRLYYRTGWDDDNKQPWNTILDSENYNLFAPTKTGGGASGTWGINITGNAASATTATNVSGKIYYSTDSPSVATDKLFTVKQAHQGEDNVPNSGLVIQTGPSNANYNGKLYITDNGRDGVWIGGIAEGKEVGWTRLVENKGSWNINSATATADANGRAFTDTNAYMHISALANSTDFNNVKTTGIYYCTGTTYQNRPLDSWGILTVYSIGTVKQEYRPDNKAGYYTREYYNTHWTTWSKVDAANADTATNADKVDGYHASDIINRISAANTGGIVAASLTKNGYVKFANGLILQWSIPTVTYQQQSSLHHFLACQN